MFFLLFFSPLEDPNINPLISTLLALALSGSVFTQGNISSIYSSQNIKKEIKASIRNLKKDDLGALEEIRKELNKALNRKHNDANSAYYRSVIEQARANLKGIIDNNK